MSGITYDLTAEQEIRARALDSAARALEGVIETIGREESPTEATADVARLWLMLANAGADFIRDGLTAEPAPPQGGDGVAEVSCEPAACVCGAPRYRAFRNPTDPSAYEGEL